MTYRMEVIKTDGTVKVVCRGARSAEGATVKATWALGRVVVYEGGWTQARLVDEDTGQVSYVSGKDADGRGVWLQVTD